MKTLLTLVVAIALVYLLLITFYALMQRSLIYYPTVIPPAEAETQAAARGVNSWRSVRGEWLGWTTRGDSITAGEPRARALVFHGNAGMALNRDYYDYLLSGLQRSGPWDVFVFEYPGYGPRQGQPSESEFLTAALEAVDQLLAKSPDPLLIIGESIGSGVASGLVRERPEAVAAVMLITPFDSMVNIARYHMPYLPAGLLLRDRYDNLSALSVYTGPLIVITAGDDTILPASFAEPLLQQHSGPLLHRIQAEAGHNTLHFNPNKPPWPEVDEFLARFNGLLLERSALN